MPAIKRPEVFMFISSVFSYNGNCAPKFKPNIAILNESKLKQIADGKYIDNVGI
jgi:hypothetical protein